MSSVDAVVRQLPFLLCEFYRHLWRRHRFRVFLCGRRPESNQTDFRIQVRRLLNTYMGCDAFLGEDISEFRSSPKPDRDHLTIEIRAAQRSDLIIIFLGSAGTLAEVTAFATNKDINPKLVVFNDVAHAEAKSFINLGPLQLIDRARVIRYEPEAALPSAALIRELDRVLGGEWFRQSGSKGKLSQLDLEAYAALLTIHAGYPIRIKELSGAYPFSERALKDSLSKLIRAKLVSKRESQYIPTTGVSSARFATGIAGDIGRVRMQVLARRMQDEEAIADYRTIL